MHRSLKALVSGRRTRWSLERQTSSLAGRSDGRLTPGSRPQRPGSVPTWPCSPRKHARSSPPGGSPTSTWAPTRGSRPSTTRPRATCCASRPRPSAASGHGRADTRRRRLHVGSVHVLDGHPRRFCGRSPTRRLVAPSSINLLHILGQGSASVGGAQVDRHSLCPGNPVDGCTHIDRRGGVQGRYPTRVGGPRPRSSDTGRGRSSIRGPMTSRRSGRMMRPCDSLKYRPRRSWSRA
jgi:hypothetical protein